ncbi:MAG: hypothetical protein CL505_03070 [Actinobacteria bacterium]|nr:hypothetical protein [Actinomycetota bacterium]
MHPDGRGGPHAFVADVDRPELSEDDRHHLANVLRLRSGDALTVSDGLGAWRPCRFGAVLELCGEPVHVPAVARRVAVGFALIKGGRPEIVVQKLTELGVDRIVLLNAERSVVRWEPDKERHQMDRLGRVAREASMQSRRVRLPVLEGLESVASYVSVPGVAMAEPGGVPLDAACSMLLVGPEGGWTHGELGSREGVGLGPTILRSETAAIAAGVLLTALREKTT